MATTKQIKQWLKENELDHAQVEEMVKELAKTNNIIKNLSEHKISWKTLPIYTIKQIPAQIGKEKEKIMKAEEDKKIKMEKEAEEKYYEENFVELMVKKIDDKKRLTEEELKTLIFEESINTVRDEPRRWSCTTTSIFKFKERFFAIVWENGLTENQEDEFTEQPYEVREEIKTVTVKKYVKIK